MRTHQNNQEVCPNIALNFYYECQDTSILETEYTYSVKLIDPSPHLCLALGYCIANSSCGWKLELFLFYA